MDKKGQKGALTVEATIALTSFLFMFITIYSLITICKAQAAIQVALNNSVKQIAQYTYLYGLTGFDESLKPIYEASSATAKDTQDFVNGIGKAFEAFSQLGSDAMTFTEDTSIEGISESIDKISKDYETSKTLATESYNKLKEYAKDPKSLAIAFLKLLATDGLELAKSRLIAAPICSSIVDNNLRTSSSDSAEAFCKRVGIVGGYDGMDFTSSTILTKNTNDITIVVKYKIKVIQLLPIDFTFEFVQVAQTLAWIHGDGAGITFPEIDFVWSKDITVDDRNKFVRGQVLKTLVEKDGFDRVSNETYVQAYNSDSNTFTSVLVSNPLYGKDNVDEADMVAIKEQLSHFVAGMESSISTKADIDIVKVDEFNCRTKKTVELASKGEKHLKVVLVIPAETGLKEKYDQIISEIGGNVTFEIDQSYGCATASGK